MTRMDISRLPLVPLARPATSSFRSTQQAAAPEAVRPVGASSQQAGARESFERVVQGELLHRERASYQSTRAFIQERTMDQTQPAGHQAGSFKQSRSAISHYLSHTRPETFSELTRGKAVNFFV